MGVEYVADALLDAMDEEVDIGVEKEPILGSERGALICEAAVVLPREM